MMQDYRASAETLVVVPMVPLLSFTAFVKASGMGSIKMWACDQELS